MRIATFIALFFISVLTGPAVAGVCAVLYALSYTAYELLFIAVCIDAYFGVVSPLPYYTLTAIVLLVCTEGIKPHLSFYTS